MAFIRIKDSKSQNPLNKLIYQGPVEAGCECILNEQLVFLWASDPTFKHGSLELFLSPEEARKIANELLHHAISIENGISDNY